MGNMIFWKLAICDMNFNSNLNNKELGNLYVLRDRLFTIIINRQLI